MIMKHFIYLLAVPLLFSCTVNDEAERLKQTDALLDTRPDSALTILDQLQHVGQMSEEGVMHYAWNHAMAHQKMGMSLEEDTLVPNAVDYYRTRKDTTKLLDGYLLKASYLRWTGREPEALQELEAGIDEARRMRDDDQLLALTGQKIGLLYRMGNYAATATTARALLDGPARLDNNAKGEVLYTLGITLSLLNDAQADRYFNESIGLAMADQQKDVAAERMRNYADALAERGDYSRANQWLRRFQQLRPERANLSVIQLSMAKNYVNLHRLDSALQCLDKADASERSLEATGHGDLTRKAGIEQLRGIIHFSQGKPVSFLSFGRYCDSVTTAMADKENTSMRRLEIRNKLQTANYELHRSRLYMALAIVILVFMLLGGGLLAVWLYCRRYQRLAEAEERIDTLTEMLNHTQATAVDKQEDTDYFRRVLLQQLGIIRLVAGTPTNQNQALLKRISAIGGGEIPTNDLLIWTDLYPLIDRLYNHFHARLMTRYGDRLTDKEVQICCLLCAGFSTKEIGVVTQQTSATIYVRKTSIRKKIGAAEGEDIVMYVNAL